MQTHQIKASNAFGNYLLSTEQVSVLTLVFANIKRMITPIYLLFFLLIEIFFYCIATVAAARDGNYTLGKVS